MRRLLIAVFVLVALIPVRADALTVRDVLELSRAGLGEDIILALIEVDRSVFPIDTPTLRRLKDAGVGERVILAMIRSQRTPPLEPVMELNAPREIPPAQPPQVIVIDHREEPRVREVLVPVPVYVPVFRRHRGDGVDVHSVRDHSDPRTDWMHQPRKAAEPVYWGWDGKLRPDAWKPK